MVIKPMSMVLDETAQTAPRNTIIDAFLHKRGLTAEAVHYLQTPAAHHQHDPFLMDGVEHWIDVLHSKKGEKLAIMPDYDVDGILSGTLLRVALYLFGFGEAYLYAPKTRDGYGLTPKSVDAIFEACPHATTLLTTDNGSNAHAGVAYAKEKGWSVLVTDHHVAESDPVADAVVNPNRRHRQPFQQYPFQEICGTAVIYKVMSAYQQKYVKDERIKQQFESLLLLVGMSTVSDVMPLLDENRYFVQESVAMLERFVESHTIERAFTHDDSPLGAYYRGMDLLVATLDARKKLNYGVSSDTFGFTTGPMLNSPRRMLGDSELGFALFQTTNESLRTQGLVASDALYDLNEERKAYVRELTAKLLAHIDGHAGLNPVDCVIFNAKMVAGVAGLLAGSFTNRYDLPSISFTVPASDSDDPAADPINASVSGLKTISGSARSPGWFDIYEFLKGIEQDYPGLILGWGGHPQAAGITLLAENYTAFRGVFTSRLKQMIYEVTPDRQESESFPIPVSGEFLIGTDTVYAVCAGYTGALPFTLIESKGKSSITSDNTVMDAVRFFLNTAPFGQGFPEPTFSTAFRMSEVKPFYMGANKQHAKLTLPNGLAVIHWNGADVFRLPDPEPVPSGQPDVFVTPDAVPDERIFTVTGKLSINEFNGRETLQLVAGDVQQIT